MLSVVANYATSYQWNLNKIPISGATAPSYFTMDAGDYTVTVTNPAGSVISGIATVVVGSSITSQPSSISVYPTQTTTFSVSAAGAGPFTYQWYIIPSGSSTGTAISGATSNWYTTPPQSAGNPPLPLPPSNNGDQYYVTVTDTCSDTLTSSNAAVTLLSGNAPPTIITQPQSTTVAVNGTPTFSVVASGSPPLTYQWYYVPAGSAQGTYLKISGATSSMYTVPASETNTSNDRDAYFVTVSNPYGAATSQQAILAVGNGILITGQPADAYVNAGAPASFTVTATSASTLSYQWYLIPPGQKIANATAISGATSATYTIASTTAAETGSVYYAVVSNGGNTHSVNSDTASLFVGVPSGIPLCSSSWNTLGNTLSLTTCSWQTAAAQPYQEGAIVWPNLIGTSNIKLSFTITTSNASFPPADGFAIVLGDPTLGATLTSIGGNGKGLGASGIPGFVLAFDNYYNGPGAPFPGDPSSITNPDYLGVGRGELALWENPYFNVNNNLPGGANALAEAGTTITHNYVVMIVQGQMVVTMDGAQVFSGTVSVPPLAYLYFTSATGAYDEQIVISNLQSTITAP
jgi:hypothetical protein